MDEIKLGIIGVGNIGSSIANGLLWSWFKGRIILCDKHPEKVENFHSDFVEVVSEAALATGKSDVIILAVKPHAVKDAIAEIG
ncbi:TPA: NAD(P)-binding domain-containing protein, partial [archaeon]|nr:NAD(P)-binding domain-containing protein [Candidatus Naiadarchaeales archaeon SRR2090159.bin1288]